LEVRNKILASSMARCPSAIGYPRGYLTFLRSPSHGIHARLVVKARIQVLEAELAARDAGIEAQRQNLVDVRQALKLLEGPAKRRWWQFRK
jgi:hypothetical protein